MIVSHVRFGALSLAASAVLFAVFPLVRPSFRMDPRVPEVTLAAAAPAVASTPWLLAHGLLTLGFVLLLVSLPTLHAALARAGAEPRAWRAMIATAAGIALVMPMLGVEIAAFPSIGRLHLDGRGDVAPMIADIYLGPLMLAFLVGLALLAVGSIMFASAIRRSGALSAPAGMLLAAGLTLWLPLLPPPVRIADGPMIGVGGVWLAASLWGTRAARVETA